MKKVVLVACVCIATILVLPAVAGASTPSLAKLARMVSTLQKQVKAQKVQIATLNTKLAATDTALAATDAKLAAADAKLAAGASVLALAPYVSLTSGADERGDRTPHHLPGRQPPRP